MARQTLPPKTSFLLSNYLLLPFRINKIPCPYWVNNLTHKLKGPFSGKGTPRQIVSVSYRKAKKLKIDLDKLGQNQLKKFLKENRIGVDCSGFIFHLLNMLDKERGGVGITHHYLGKTSLPSWRAAWKINADTLSSNKFTKMVATEKARPGDIIRLLGGKHIALITQTGNHSLTYAHCSNYTSQRGCHLGRIAIKDWGKSLESQIWEEQTNGQKNYREATYFPSLGDSIRRLKWWDS